MNYEINPSQLSGSLVLPSSKSHSMRAILFATMAEGISTLRALLPSPDIQAMLAACQALGAEISIEKDPVKIRGTKGQLKTPQQVIDAGNSGQVLRFIAALCALLPQYSILTGDASLCSLRPMQPLLDALSQAGVMAVSSKNDGHAPIIIRGPIKACAMRLNGQDSQPVSALLMLAAFLEGETEIIVDDPGELPWIELTLSWLDRFDVSYDNDQFTRYKVRGPLQYAGFEYTVPGDWSSAAFPLAAALITRSELVLDNLDPNDVQGDKRILQVLEEMGAKFLIDAKNKRICVLKSSELKGAEIDVNALIDALPILATLACFAQGPTRLYNAGIARHKESDRLAVISRELRKMGAKIEEEPTVLIIHPQPLKGARVDSAHDHRIAMSLAVAGLGAVGKTTVMNTHCVDKSYPYFVEQFKSLGAAIEKVS